MDCPFRSRFRSLLSPHGQNLRSIFSNLNEAEHLWTIWMSQDMRQCGESVLVPSMDDRSNLVQRTGAGLAEGKLTGYDEFHLGS